MRSKYPTRSRFRALGLPRVEAFGKYLFLRKVARPGPVNRLILVRDVLRWRIYYAVQGQWPAAR